MNMTRCNFCGGTVFTSRRLDYLYSQDGKFLLVPNTPADVCDNCGMEFYPASAVKEIERHFFAIHSHTEQPDSVLQVPCKALA